MISFVKETVHTFTLSLPRYWMEASDELCAQVALSSNTGARVPTDCNRMLSLLFQVILYFSPP